MTEAEKQAWEKVRAEGRDRFLLKSIAQCWRFLVAGLLVEVCWWLVSGKLTQPMWQIAVGWLFLAVGCGAWWGISEWNTNEQKYRESTGASPAS